MRGHPVLFDPAVMPADVADELVSLMERLGEFRTHAADLKFYHTTHEHIGEATPLLGGRCEHPYLVPSSDRSSCVLPGRIDVARAYVKSGGVEALKEPHARLLSRVQSFARYHFNISEFPVVQALFARERFQRLAVDVCPRDKQVLDPFAFTFIVNLPGQSVAPHVDGVFFHGADRFHVPQWLLAVMAFSGLFRDRFIDQVQVVAYIHKWEDAGGARGGEFVYWPDASGVPRSIPPAPLSGSGVDGTKIVHAAKVYMPSADLPALDKSGVHALQYAPEAGRWALTTDGATRRTYAKDELRFSIVYRARCFASEGERERFASQRRGNAAAGEPSDMMPLADILATLKGDLARRDAGGAAADGAAVAARRAALDALPPLELAMRLIDGYARYPLSHTAAVPLNYCALKLIAPRWVGAVIDLIC